MMTLNETIAELEAQVAPPDVELARQISQLDHLFRCAGDSPEVRLIYQLVLDFRKSQRAA